jgi:hypothetical protein
MNNARANIQVEEFPGYLRYLRLLANGFDFGE